LGTNCANDLGEVGPRDAHTTNAGFAGTEDTETGTYAFYLDYNLGWGSFTSITSFQDAERTVFADDGTQTFGGIIESIFIDEYEGWTQEFRLASESEGAFNWTAGFYLSSDELISYRSFSLPPNAFGPFSRSRFNDVKTDIAAFFVDGTYDLSNTMTFTAGARVTKDERDWDYSNYLNFSTIPGGTFVDEAYTFANHFLNVPSTNTDEEWDEPSWRLALNWAVSDEVSLFGSISKGFRGGEVNAGAEDLIDVNISEPEYLTSYEVGLKSRFLDNTLGLSISAYFYDYEDKILFVEIPTTNPETGEQDNSLQAFNGSEVEVKGLELLLDWQATEGLYFSINASYIEGEYIEAGFTLPDGTDITGHDVENTPETTVSTLAQYRWALSNGMEIMAQADYYWRDDYFFSAVNSPAESQESYGLLGASLSLISSGGEWEVRLWGKNLTDEEYVTDGFNFGGLQAYVGAPSVVGATASFNF
jgi:iron complex outermembrane recepter protein